MSSDLPQGLMLGSLLLLIYFNDLDLQAIISKFTDNAHLGSIVNCEEDSDELQKDINWSIGWAEEL